MHFDNSSPLKHHLSSSHYSFLFLRRRIILTYPPFPTHISLFSPLLCATFNPVTWMCSFSQSSMWQYCNAAHNFLASESQICLLLLPPSSFFLSGGGGGLLLLWLCLSNLPSFFYSCFLSLQSSSFPPLQSFFFLSLHSSSFLSLRFFSFLPLQSSSYLSLQSSFIFLSGSSFFFLSAPLASRWTLHQSTGQTRHCVNIIICKVLIVATISFVFVFSCWCDW